jgi:hypothetical protein
MFGDMTLDAWKKSGKDTHSIIADPLFVNAPAFDFHFKRNRPVRKIKFVPFDYTQAGVYGSEEWKNLARFDPELKLKFDRVIEANERK